MPTLTTKTYGERHRWNDPYQPIAKDVRKTLATILQPENSDSTFVANSCCLDIVREWQRSRI